MKHHEGPSSLQEETPRVRYLCLSSRRRRDCGHRTGEVDRLELCVAQPGLAVCGKPTKPRQSLWLGNRTPDRGGRPPRLRCASSWLWNLRGVWTRSWLANALHCNSLCSCGLTLCTGSAHASTRWTVTTPRMGTGCRSRLKRSRARCIVDSPSKQGRLAAGPKPQREAQGHMVPRAVTVVRTRCSISGALHSPGPASAHRCRKYHSPGMCGLVPRSASDLLRVRIFPRCPSAA